MKIKHQNEKKGYSDRIEYHFEFIPQTGMNTKNNKMPDIWIINHDIFIINALKGRRINMERMKLLQ